MKILIIVTKSEIGGAQVFVLNLVKGLKALGNEVEVAAGTGGFLFDELEKLKVKNHYLNSLRRDFNVFRSFYFIYDLYKLLSHNRYDIIHLNSSNTLVGSYAPMFLDTKPKTVFTFHGLSFLDKNYEMNMFFRFLAKLYFKVFIRHIDKSVFVSKKNYLESKKALKISGASIIYNGLEDSLCFLTHSEARDYFSQYCGFNFNNIFLIGSTGRLAYPKNYDFLIKNFNLIKVKIPEAKVVVIGDGPNYKKYQNEINELGINEDFFFIGAIKDSYKYIKAFDVFTLPSNYEGLSISLIEAVFAEIPILASNVGGNIEIVGENYDQVFELNNINEYITKLLYIKDNKEKISRLNKELKKFFSLNKMVDKYQDLYESLLK